MDSYPKYRDITQFKIESQLKRLRLIIDFLQSEPLHSQKALRILDVGCGPGNIALPIASLGHEVLGIDLDEPPIKTAITLNKFKNASFRVAEVKDLESDLLFDVIICSEVVEHIEKDRVDEFLTVILSHLEKNGKLIITIPNGFSLFELVEFVKNSTVYFLRHISLFETAQRSFYKKILKREPKDKSGVYSGTIRFSDHLYHYTMKRFRRLISRHGLEIAQQENTNFISTIFPLYMIPSKRYRLKYAFDKIDCNIADYMPAQIVNNWFFVLGRRK